MMTFIQLIYYVDFIGNIDKLSNLLYFGSSMYFVTQNNANIGFITFSF